eukprot:5624068-Heterocapsa_arctica.AAC.1
MPRFQEDAVVPCFRRSCCSTLRGLSCKMYWACVPLDEVYNIDHEEVLRLRLHEEVLAHERKHTGAHSRCT